MRGLLRWAAVAVLITVGGPGVARAEPPKAQLTKEGDRLFKAADAERKKKNFEAALMTARKCVSGSPGHYPCYRLLGVVYAAIAVRDQSASDMEKAREAYEQYLTIAPADDEYVPKVRAVLEQKP